MKYAMTIKSNSTNYTWTTCNATNLTAAKKECTRTIGKGAYVGELLVIAEVYGDDYRIVATKISGHKTPWENIA